MRAIALVIVSLFFQGLVEAAPAVWRGADLGADAAPGGSEPASRHTWDGTTLVITGSGAGLDVKPKDDKGRVQRALPAADHCRFVFVERAAGDFEIVARLSGLAGGSEPTAGIMIRAAADGSKPGSPLVAAIYRGSDQSLGWLSRMAADEVHPAPRTLRGGIKLASGPPVWIRLVRMGKNFAVYKSRDGLTGGPDDHRLWVMLGNTSGGPFGIDGPLEVGLFAAGGPDGAPATATFDSIEVGPARMRYRTSWVGNTFGSRDDDKHVSNGISAMWVAPDGTSYTSSYWDEGGRPVTSYTPDGKPGRALSGTPQSNEGGISGDKRFVYYAFVDKVMQHDRENPGKESTPIEMSVSLHNQEAKQSVVSGLASDGKELFIADSRDNLIRVASLEPPKMRWRPIAANPRVQMTPEPVAVEDPRLAPALVYQTQRGGEGIQYTFEGLVPEQAYTVRLHLAEFEDRKKLAADDRARFIGIQGERVNVAEVAGGIRRAYVHDVQRKADKDGKVTIGYGSYGPGACGVEVLDAAGKRRVAVNCGGPPVDGFEGESQEMVDRAFAVDRPGPMIVDQRGDLWIIQCGNEFPIGAVPHAKYPAAIKCYKKDGTFTGRQITDVVNPRGLGYDAVNDRLLVGENGPDLNVRVYGGLDSRPTLLQTFGEKGGIYAGNTPGLVNDPSAGGAARFAGIAGLGVDSKGNLYVGGGFAGSDLRKFAPRGKGGWNGGQPEWQLNSLMFCNTYDVDPDSDGADLYGTYNHLKLDLSQTAPGREQQFFGYSWDLRRYGNPDRAGSSQSILRRLGPDRRLVMVTSGQGQVGDIKIFRYEGEIAIPAGGTRDRGKILWIDTNADGRDDPDELTTMASPIGWITGLCVDSKGDIWAGNATTGGCFMRRFFFKGMSEKGVPLYDGRRGEGYEDIRFPEEGDKTNAWGMACRLDYDADRDMLVAMYPAAPRKGDSDYTPPYFVARYDEWSKGNRLPRWKQRALEPSANPDFFMYEVNQFPHRGYMGMQIAGDYVFFAYLFGEVHVFDLATGKLAEILSVGPECNGQSAWEDAAMGLRAFKRSDGEYLIFTENSGWGGKNNFFRWKP